MIFTITRPLLSPLGEVIFKLFDVDRNYRMYSGDHRAIVIDCFNSIERLQQFIRLNTFKH